MATAKIEYGNGLIHKKIIDILVDAGAVGKDEVNKDQGFKFRGIDSVVNAINPLLKKHRVAVLPTKIQKIDVERFENANKKIVTDAVVVVEYTWIAEDGSSFTTEVTGQGRDFADKAVAKGNSVAFRTLLLQSLALPTSDADPDSESIEIQASETPKPTPKPAAKPVTKNDLAGLRAAVKAKADEMGNATGTKVDYIALGDRLNGQTVENRTWHNTEAGLTKTLNALNSGEVA